MDGEHNQGFGGRAVVAFESRRAPEMASLIERHGGSPVSAPTMREVPIEANHAALAFAQGLREGAFDRVILMTGVGTRALLDEIAPALDRPAFAAALGRTRAIARGPKPAQALREIGATGFVTVPEPNTWREVFVAVESMGALGGLHVAVQEHGAPSVELYEALTRAGARVTAVPVYKWALPEDTAKLRSALHRIASGEASIALFTSRAQVEHALGVAAEENIAAAVRAELRRGVVASIGPVCSEALAAEALPPDLEPTHPKMGHLVKETAARASDILARKRT